MKPQPFAPPVSAPGRVPPNSVEAEEQLLSACLLDGADVLNRAIEAKIRPASFYFPANRVIYEIMLRCLDARKPIDLYIIGEELKATRQLDEIGGYGYLTRVSGRIPTTAGAAYFIEKVRELAILRDCIRAATGIVEDAYGYSGGLDEYIGKAEASMLSATQDRIAGDSSHAGALVEGALADFVECAKNPGKMMGLPTGYKDVDVIVGGLRPAEMIVIAGRPSSGKTSIALNIAENLAIPRPGVAAQVGWIASLEMSKQQLGHRLLAQRARVNVKMATSGLFKKGSMEMARMIEARDEYRACKLFIDDESQMTVSMIAAKARRIHARYGLSFLEVDYLGLVRASDPTVIREQQVAEASKGLKALAKELNIPVIVLCQLNREGVKTNRPPVLSDLRESGSIEQDADVVLMLHPKQEDGSASQVASPTMQFFVHKNRNGSVGDGLLTFLPSITRFENYTR